MAINYLVGLTGPFAAGKGFVAELLQERGFSYYSLSDVLREELRTRELEETRENLIDLGNQLRSDRGEGALADILAERVGGLEKDIIIDSIRNPAEVDSLRGLEGFILVAVDAHRNLRYRRILERGREGDAKTVEELSRLDEKDIKIGIYDCVDKADYVIYNVNKNAFDVRREVDRFVGRRPDWDEYYWNIADAVGLRGTCMKMQFGAVIVNHGQIIATGYVGAPRGEPNCIDLGVCYRKKYNIPRGTRYESCRSVHAEQNAMQHASRRDMLGGDMYVAGRDLLKPGHPIVAAHPCNLCQKEIKQSLNRVVTFDAEGKKHEYFVKDWIEESKRDPFAHLVDPGYK
jgi:dCMP deaminase